MTCGMTGLWCVCRFSEDMIHSSQSMTVACEHTCPDTLVGIAEARRAAVAPPVALMDHCPSSAPPLLLLAPTLPPEPVRPPEGPDLLSPPDLEGTHRQTWENSLKAGKYSALVSVHQILPQLVAQSLSGIPMGCMHDKAGWVDLNHFASFTSRVRAAYLTRHERTKQLSSVYGSCAKTEPESSEQGLQGTNATKAPEQHMN